MRAEAILDLKQPAKQTKTRKRASLQAVPSPKIQDELDSCTEHRQNKSVLGLAVLLVLVAAGLFFSINSLRSIFMIEHVQIRGQFQNEQAHQVQSVLSPYLSRDLLTVSLAAARNALFELAWVQQAQLQRQWPNQVIVQIKEHSPVARWNDVALLNTEGQVFKQSYALRQLELPQLYGPDGREYEVLQQYQKIKTLLQASNFRITSLHLDERNSWSMQSQNGTEFRLGVKDIESRLHRVLAVLVNNIGSDAGALKSIDLRHSNGFAVSWKESSLQDKGSA